MKLLIKTVAEVCTEVRQQCTRYKILAKRLKDTIFAYNVKVHHNKQRHVPGHKAKLEKKNHHVL